MYLLKYELNLLNNRKKGYLFKFYNIFNFIKSNYKYFKSKCKKKTFIKGLKIQIKGRYTFKNKKSIYLLNLGNINKTSFNIQKDYYYLNFIKTTGISSIKIWINYKK